MYFQKKLLLILLVKIQLMGLALSPLDKTIRNISKLNYRTTVHSDQGWHYQFRFWVET